MCALVSIHLHIHEHTHTHTHTQTDASLCKFRWHLQPFEYVFLDSYTSITNEMKSIGTDTSNTLLGDTAWIKKNVYFYVDNT